MFLFLSGCFKHKASLHCLSASDFNLSKNDGPLLPELEGNGEILFKLIDAFGLNVFIIPNYNID